MLAAAVTLALAFWGPLPCVPTVTVADLDAAQAVGRYTLHHDGTCLIEIDSREWTWKDLSYTVLHEYGHAAGLQHSTDRRSVMFPRLPKWTHHAVRGRRPPQYERGERIRL
jgi:predicted Zn-dependent protease